MLKKRLIPCLDVKDNQVVKGVQFRAHEVVGDIIDLAKRYSDAGADELVFYDITASSEGRAVSTNWVSQIAKEINIPFCVAGGIRSIKDAENILAQGADKISINSPALENPNFINELATRFGVQCVVVGIDSFHNGTDYQVHQYTGDEAKTRATTRLTPAWAKETAERGAGEIVLNCMNQDGVRKGYDLEQLKLICDAVTIPVIASGGAGALEHFKDVFEQTKVSGALAASVFHKNILTIPRLKSYLTNEKIAVRS